MIEQEGTAAPARTASQVCLKLAGSSPKTRPNPYLNCVQHWDFGLSKSDENLAFVSTKISRLERTKRSILDLIDRGYVSSAQADSLRGKLQSTERHVFGRVGAGLLKAFE